MHYTAEFEDRDGEIVRHEFEAENDSEARAKAANMAKWGARLVRLVCVDGPHGRLVA